MWRPRQFTRSQGEERRLDAGRLLQAGQLSYADIARQLGVSRMAVSTWARQLYQRQGDLTSLHTRPIPGRPARLGAEQWQRVLARSSNKAPSKRVLTPIVGRSGASVR